MTVVNHALFGVSIAALAGAGIRGASAFVDRGLERILAAAVLACAAAVLETMFLALFSLGASQLALSGSACVTWILARTMLPQQEVSVGKELRGWLDEAPRKVILSIAAGVAFLVTWIAWELKSTILAVDSIVYHLPQIIQWIHSGSPGAVDRILYFLWVGNYPLVDGIAQAWGMGISRSMVMVSIWPGFNFAVLCIAGWVVLRSLGVSVRLRVLAILSVATIPSVLVQLDGPLNDLPALSWLACGAALFACARRTPRAAIPAIVALGLSVGTKTISLPLGVAVMVAGLWSIRANARSMARPLAAAGAAFIFVGGFWYIRDFVEHGSPFWPWAASPWGDPMPHVLHRYSSLLSHLRDTLHGRIEDYLTFFGGSAVLLGVAALTPLLSRDRMAKVAGLGVVLLTLLWAAAPSTARARPAVFDGSISQVRYLLPTMGLAAMSIAFAGRRSRRAELVACVLFASACGWNFAQLFTGAFPASPADKAKLLGLFGGAALGFVAVKLARGRLLVPGGFRTAGLTIGAAALLAIPASGWVARHGETQGDFDAGLAHVLSSRDQYRNGNQPIWMAPVLAGPLSGDSLQHDLLLIPASESCQRVAARRRSGWVILQKQAALRRTIGYTVGDCLTRERPLAVVNGFRVYAPYRPAFTAG